MATHRRRFIQWSGAAGAFVVLGPLAGCGGSGGRDAREEPPAPDAAGSAAPADPCADVSGLTPEQVEFREDAGYVAETPIPEERCDNCRFWRAPRGGEPCGGCTVMAGPVHAAGYCDLWEAPA